MKRTVKISGALLLALSFVLMMIISAVPVLAATDPYVDYTGSWDTNNSVLTLTGRVNNPDNKFYSGSCALDYDDSLFELVETNNPTMKDGFTKIKNEKVSDGHVITDFAYFDETGGLAPKSTPTDAYDISFKLKEGKTIQDVKSDSIKLSDHTFLSTLEEPYKSGPEVLYCSKDNEGNEDSDDRTKYTVSDTSGKVSYPLNKNVTDLKVTPETASIPKGRTITMKAEVTPADATDPSVVWSSSDEKIAKVDPKTGVVTGVSPGKATITATTNDGGIKKTAEITVTDKVIDKIIDSNVTTEAGTAPILPTRVKVQYSDGTEAEVPVTWDSVSASSYASPGSFEVKGKVEGIDDKAICKVKVTAKSGSNTNNNGSSNSGTNNGSAKTGDNIRALAIMTVLLIVSIAVIVAIIIISRRKKSQKDDQ